MNDLAGVLLLWDIDGTLVTHAPSARDRHAHAVSTVLARPVDPLPAGIGKTDRQILIELFADHLPSDAEIERAFEVIDEITVDATVDRLLHRSVVINLDGKCYRPCENHARNEQLRRVTTGTRIPPQ